MIRETIVKVFTAIIVIFILLMAVLSQTTLFDLEPIPYGVWRCYSPDITMDITPYGEYYGTFYGEYIKDNVTFKVDIGFYNGENTFAIYSTEITEFGVRDEYFLGKFKVKKDGKLYYSLFPRWQESSEYETIVFEKIHSYD